MVVLCEVTPTVAIIFGPPALLFWGEGWRLWQFISGLHVWILCAVVVLGDQLACNVHVNQGDSGVHGSTLRKLWNIW